jgi:hypothetical protein
MPIGSCQGCTEGGPSHCQDVRSTRNAPPATQASRPTAASAARGNFQSRTSPRTQPGTKTTRRCSSGRRPRPITTPISGKSLRLPELLRDAGCERGDQLEARADETGRGELLLHPHKQKPQKGSADSGAGQRQTPGRHFAKCGGCSPRVGAVGAVDWTIAYGEPAAVGSVGLPVCVRAAQIRRKVHVIVGHSAWRDGRH